MARTPPRPVTGAISRLTELKASYCAPAALAARHQISADLAGKLAGIGPLTTR